MNIYHLQERGKFNETYVLCEVIEFDDGQTLAKWIGNVRLLVIHKDIEEFKEMALNDTRELNQIV